MLDKNIILEQAKKEEKNGNYQIALNLLEKIFDVKDFSIAFEYAKTLYILKKYNEALDIFLELNNKNTNNSNIIDFIIKCYRENNQTEQLLSFIQKNNITDSKISLEMAETFFIEKKYKESIKFYEQYVEYNKNDIGVVSRLLQIYNFLGYKKQAVDLSDEYLQKENIKNDKFLYNLFLNEQEIAQEKIILKSKPRIMLVMLTNKCNLKCPMCKTIKHKNKWDISKEFKEYIIDNLDNLELITWQGGEVFLYDDFKYLFFMAKENKYLKQIIITNGLLINEEWADIITQANHLDLTISIDSIDKNVYEKLRVGAKFEQLLTNLEYINKARIKNSSNITVTVRVTISDENIYTLDKFIDFAKTYNINILIFNPLTMTNGKKYCLCNKTKEELVNIKNIMDKTFLEASKSDIKIISFLDNIKSLENINDKNFSNIDSISNKCFNRNIKEPLCFRPWKQISTTVDGEIRPECMCLKNLDDMHVCKDFNNLWNNDIMQKYRKKLLDFNQQWCCDNCKNDIVSKEHKKIIF